MMCCMSCFVLCWLDVCFMVDVLCACAACVCLNLLYVLLWRCVLLSYECIVFVFVLSVYGVLCCVCVVCCGCVFGWFVVCDVLSCVVFCVMCLCMGILCCVLIHECFVYECAVYVLCDEFILWLCCCVFVCCIV